jgi:adenine-specific DNA-methyltransferase
MDEIFGPENFVATLIWQKVFSPKNSARHFSEDHDYIVVYARNAEVWKPNLLQRTEEMEARYSNPDKDERGPWTSGDLSARNYYSEGTYSITCPSGRIISGPPAGTYWRVSKKRFEELDQDKRVWWGLDGNNAPRLKRFLSEVQQGRVPQTLLLHGEVGNTQEAKRELMAAVTFENSDSVFDTPKPTRLMKRILELATDAKNSDIVLDFFAGSGSTLHGLFQKNAEDGGNRRGLLVQLPEPIPGAENDELRNISDITKARLRKVSNGIRTGSSAAKGDFGFRLFKLASSNIRAWDADPTNLENNLLSYAEHLVPGRTEQDVLYELLLKLGLDLCVPIETKTIAGKAVYSIGGGVLIVCLADGLTQAVIEPLSAGIVAWRDELAPVVDTRVVFKDAGFSDDVAKTNMASILNQNGIADVRSL